MACERLLGYDAMMNRRHLLYAASAFALPIQRLQAIAADQPWTAVFHVGGFDGKTWKAGVQITLLPGWKTYWRVPGAAGIAPAIDLQGANLKSVEMFYPLPMRLKAGEDDVIGYKDDVVFPLLLEPVNANEPLSVKLSAFLGVCDQVCIPVKLETELAFQKTKGSTSSEATILKWIGKVPAPSTGLVQEAGVAMGENGNPIVKLRFARAVLDVFAEGKSSHYFHLPVFSGNDATMRVSGAKTVDDLKGQQLRLTITTENGGVEETVTIV
jgi:DsbC/DsbD-like thiol-disulfide interchange protein